MKAENIILCTPIIHCYLQRILGLTTAHKLVEYEQGKSFNGFEESRKRKTREDTLKSS